MAQASESVRSNIAGLATLTGKLRGTAERFRL
jgi:hypothetical protein